MQKLQKYKVVVSNGAIAKEEALGDPKPIVDSVADNLVIDGEHLLEAALANKRAVTLQIWKEVMVAKPKAEPQVAVKQAPPVAKRTGRPVKKANSK